MSGIRVLLFDVDDTLFDRRVFLDAFMKSDEMAGRKIDRSPTLVDVRLERWRIFLELLGRDERLSAEIHAHYMRLYPRIVIQAKGAFRVVRALSRRYRLGIVSNGFKDFQYHKLEKLGILGCFDCIVLFDEVGVRKPDKRIFLEALDRLGASPCECLYIGDSYEYDMRGASAEEMGGCWLNPEGREPPPGFPRPCLVIRRLSDLFSVL
jgi:putative hydrolase of the HAD superfamily